MYRGVYVLRRSLLLTNSGFEIQIHDERVREEEQLKSKDLNF